ncbi:hypothetical protein BV25DRAFT_775065 [Artomyces pyxidatus]|uniref:Uncharacterized protein n=1 Tax=Artomyces pyxidatus TaxID=48021 RepID=A0ACB8SZN7_9AGAM|nr:hypothetical protein BV25DRAFT_775065 [Artomyces pyxidatus]
MVDYQLANSMGAMFIGLVIDSVLYGIMTFQTYYFFNSDERDRLSLRLLILLLWCLDTFQLILVCHAMYHFLILHYGQPGVLEYSVWSLDLEVAPTVLITFIVRCFFTVRLWHLSQQNIMLITAVMVFSFAQLGLGLVICGLSFKKKAFDQLPHYEIPVALQQASAVVADILISGPLVYYLHKSKTGVTRTNSLINQLIVWSVNTALVTGVIELAQLVVWVGMTRTLIFIPFHFILAKLYTNCMLAMLNGRQKLRETFEGHSPVNTSMIIAPDVLTAHTTQITFPPTSQGSLSASTASKTYSRYETPSTASFHPRRMVHTCDLPLVAMDSQWKLTGPWQGPMQTEYDGSRTI